MKLTLDILFYFVIYFILTVVVVLVAVRSIVNAEDEKFYLKSSRKSPRLDLRQSS